MRLGVNVDHIATLRQARRGRVPDPIEAARVCEQAGASSIVCHLREDRRHIHDEDVRRLKRAVTTRLNLEMSIAPDIVRVALSVGPDQVTLVPERRRELTTEGGLDVVELAGRLAPLIQTFHARGIAVSLFVEPRSRQLKAARAVGARIIELHTGRYAGARTPQARGRALQRLARAAAEADAMHLSVAAGHGLDEETVGEVAAIPEVEEVNIGFSIVARALSVGLEQAVRDMVERLREVTHACDKTVAA